MKILLAHPQICRNPQAAPRFFVNDVIVRFHKTLELEEDEVKTLICRYPPPLAPPQLSDSNIVAPIANSRPTNSEIETNSFVEFVEPSPGTKKSNSNNIETLSENLIVAPSGGLNSNQQHNKLAEGENPYAIVNRLQQQHHQNRPPVNVITADQFNSRNAQINQLESASSGQSQSYFDRLSSIELLFLISSLMFLVLLAFGLAGSYYCFQRQSAAAMRRRRQSMAAAAALRHQHIRANEILKSTNRSFASGGSRGTAMQPAYYQPTLINHHHHHHASRFQANSSPDNSDSNLSRHLLTTTSSNIAPPATRYAVYNNQAYVPEMTAQQYVNLSANQQGTLAHSAANKSPPIPGNNMTAYRASARAYNNQQQRALMGPQNQVLGRRETVYAGGGFAPAGRSHYNSNKLLSTRQEFASDSDAKRLRRAEFFSSSPEVEPQQQQQQFHYSNTITDNMLNRRGHDTLSRAHGYTLINRRAKPNLYRAQAIYVGPEADKNSLFRTKSLSSVGQRGALDDLEPGEDFSSPGILVGGRRINSKPEIRYKYQQQSKYTSTNENKDQFELNNNSEAEPKLVLKSIEDSYITNYTEISEQEYMKRDSRKPLSLAEWRSLRRQSTTNASDQSTSSSEKDLRSVGLSDQDEKVRNNLRSLTEVDVNFARSMAGQSDKLADNKAELEAGKQTESPDLILSPDYDHGEQDESAKAPESKAKEQPQRLELIRGADSESHNSVSYV